MAADTDTFGPDLDQLYAYHPVTGKLHSCSPDYPGVNFEAAMLRQGYRVERLSSAAALARHRPPQVRAEPAPAPAPVEEEPAGLPEMGTWIIHPTLGRALVSYTITMPEGPVPVCTGPKGSGLVKPGEWQPVTPEPEPVPEPEPLAPPPVVMEFERGARYIQPSLWD